MSINSPNSVASHSRTLTSWDTADTFDYDHEDEEEFEAMLEQDIGEVSYFKDMGYKSKEMEHFLKVELPHGRSKASHPDYHEENLFPKWILDNHDWQMTAHQDKANEISELVQISWSDRTQDQNSALIHWLMSVWPTASQMGFKKCGMMWRVFSLLNFKPSQDIIREGERGLTFYIIISGKAVVLKKDIGQVAQLRTGHSFGELALTEGDDQRSATVRAVTHMEILQLHKVDYDHFVKDIQVAERRENFHILKSCILFTNWTKSKIQKMCNACIRKTFNPGEYIFEQGDPCDSIYFVVDGKIDVYKEVVVVVRNRWPTSTGLQGISKKKKKPFLVHNLKKGDYFGEQAITQDQLRTVSCIANTVTTVLSLDRLEFAHYIENDVAIQIMKNAHDDYIQDKQILNSMIMSCKIRGGPSTTAQLNKCLEIVNEYRPKTTLPVKGKVVQTTKEGSDTPPSTSSSNTLTKQNGRNTQNKKPKSASKMITTKFPDQNIKASGPSSSADIGDKQSKMLPPNPTGAIKRAETIPFENFFVGSENRERVDISKEGILAEEGSFDEDDDDPLMPFESSQPQHLYVMKSDHLELMRSKRAPRNFSRQLAKMSNCADELRIHRCAAHKKAKGDDDSSVGDDSRSLMTTSTDAPPTINTDDDSTFSGVSKKRSDDEDSRSQYNDKNMLRVLAGVAVDIKREKATNYLVKAPLHLQKLSSISGNKNMRLSFNDNVKVLPPTETVVSVAKNLRKSKSNPKIKVKENYIPTIGSIKSVEMKSEKGRLIKSQASSDISNFVSARRSGQQVPNSVLNPHKSIADRRSISPTPRNNTRKTSM